MKRTCGWLLLLIFILAGIPLYAAADSETGIFEHYAERMAGRTFTLTVHAEEIDGLEEVLAPYPNVSCVAKHEDGRITVDVTGGELYLNLTADSEGVQISTNLIEVTPIFCSWEELAPNIEITDGEDKSFSVSMTGPEQELIRFSCRIKGNDPSSYHAAFSIGFITGPGAVYGLWDDLYAKNGESSRDFALTYGESMLTLEGFGTEETEGNGLLRTEECTVYLDDEEIGTLTLQSLLTIK